MNYKIFFVKTLVILLFPLLIFSQHQLDHAEKLYADEKYEKAITSLKSYLESYPKNTTALELLGDAYGKLKIWDQAKEAYKELAETHPKNANYHYKYGGVLGMMAKQNKMKALGYLDDIKVELKKAADLDPSHIDVRWALVQFYMELPGIFGGSMETSLKYANELEKISKVDGYLAKGYIYQEDGDEDEAEKYYKMAVSVGGSILCYEKLANFYMVDSQFENALKTYNSGYKNLEHNYFLYKIGEISAEKDIALEQGEQSLQTFIINFSSKDKISLQWAHYRLAQIYRNMGEKGKALSQIDLALNHRPQQKEFKKEKALIERL